MSTPQRPHKPSSPRDVRPVTTLGLGARKREGVKITAITAYDFLTASIADESGIDIILVGDSLANTALGYETTLPVSVEEMLVAVRAVRRGVRRSLLVADMPFGSYQKSDEDAMANAITFLKTGAEAVKLEGGSMRADLVRRLVDNGIPVMGHIGLTPQSVHALGGYRVQGRGAQAADRLLDDARALEASGAFSVVVEGVPLALGEMITRELRIPTIGIGAGPACDGQILVISDLLGWNASAPPRFVRRYANLREEALDALRRYREDVVAGAFPEHSESYDPPPVEDDATTPHPQEIPTR